MDEDRDLYQSIVENFPDAICVLDCKGKIIFSNSKTAILLGLTGAKELIGKYIGNFLAPADCQAAMDFIAGIGKGKKICKAEYNFIRKDGSQFTGETAA